MFISYKELVFIFCIFFPCSIFANGNTKECPTGFEKERGSSLSETSHKKNDLFKIEIDDSLERQIGYVFKNPNLKTISITHSNKERKYHTKDGKQLDFLGDIVFGLSVFDIFMRLYPNIPLVKLNISSALSNANQANIAISFKIDQSIIKSFSGSKTRSKKRYLATFLEALVGLVYLDGGYIEARKLVARLIKEKIKGYKEEDYRTLFEVNSDTHFSGEKQMALSSVLLDSQMTKKLRSLGHHILELHVTHILINQFPGDTSSILQSRRSRITKRIHYDTLRYLYRTSLSMYPEVKERVKIFRPPRAELHFLLGLVYLVEGYERTKALMDHVVEWIYERNSSVRSDRALLNKFAKEQFQTTPQYKIKQIGAKYRIEFIVEVWINEKMLGRGYSRSEKRAVKAAIHMALKELGL